MKIKNFCLLKDAIKRVERHPSEWEKIFAIHVSMEDSHLGYIKDSCNSIRKRLKT